MEQLLAWDTTLFLWLNGQGTSTFDPFWLMMSAKGTNVVVYLVFVFFYGRKYGWKSGLYLFILAAALVGLTDQITNLFKNGFMRLRPCHEESLADSMRLVKSSCGGLYSFFSGHSSNSFALATLFSLFFKQHKNIMPILYVFAGLIAYSRVYLGVHYPIDISCGAMAGTFIGALVYSLVNKRAFPQLPNY